MSSADVTRGDDPPMSVRGEPMAESAIVSARHGRTEKGRVPGDAGPPAAEAEPGSGTPSGVALADRPVAPRGGTGTAGAAPRAVRGTLRFFANDLRVTFFRRRNQLLLLVGALFPLLIGIGLKAAQPKGGGGHGLSSGSSAYFSQLAGNGVFLTFVALSLLLLLVLPMIVGVVAGDSIAGEAGYGTLRYLLAVPAGRTRLLAVKYATVVVWAVTATFVVSVIALVTGVALFGAGPVTLLSGETVSLAAGLVRVLWVTLYVCAAMAAFGAIALAISTFTEHAIGAIAASLIIAVGSEVVENVPQFAPVNPYLPTNWWLDFDSLLRTPVDTTTLWHGLLSFAVYAVIFLTIAWARFTSADVTS
jgi:ABC-2 type transport system permease protein